jgi:hypothetical protein
MAFGISRFTPTLSTDAYALGDVLFGMTEVTLPSRSCRLVGGFVVDYENQTNSDAFNIHFFQVNNAELGTVNATADITDANFKLNQYLGSITKGSIAPSNLLDNLTPYVLSTFGDSNYSDDDPGSVLGPVLTSVDTGYKIYASAVLSVVSTAPDFTANDALEIILHFEY